MLGGTGKISGTVGIGAGSMLTAGTLGTSAANAAANVGTLNVGALTLASTAVLAVDVGTASSFDVIKVTGTVNLGGATLALNIASGLTFTGPIILIDNDGTDAFTGTFANVAQGSIVNSGGYSFVASYVGGDGNDFTLTAVPEPSTYVGGGFLLGLFAWSQRKRILRVA